MKLLLTLALLAGASWGGWYYWDENKGAQESMGLATGAHTVARGPLTISVSENGYLKAKNSRQVKPTFRGEGLITWLIDEGTEVAEGDVLIEFEKKELQGKIDELKSEIIQAEVQLEGSKATLEIENRESTAAIEKAELALEIAQLELEKWEKGENPNQLRKLKLAKDRAQREWERAKENFERVPELAKEGFFTKTEVDLEELNVQEKEIALETATGDLHLHEEYTQVMQRKQKRSKVKDAERELLNARQKAEISSAEKEANVTRQEGALAALKLRLEKQAEDLESMTIRAPQSGLVTYGDPARPWYRDQVKVGSRVYRHNTLITLPDLREMEVLIRIHEADIDKVELEQNALITLDTYPGQVFTGKVTDIATVATSSGWDENTKSFRVVVSMDPSETEFRAGISAKVEVQVDELEEALSVPLHSVYVEEGEHFVFLVTGSGFQRREVEVGRNNVHSVEVLEGLEPGERIYLFDPRSGEEESGLGSLPVGDGLASEEAGTP